jgi:2-phosphosulfolactate phosphatase
MRWFCHDLFHRMPVAATAGGIAVVVDVLRASTTMITALGHGAAAVHPVAGVDEARRLAARLGPAALLGGERGGLPIPGFDLGNSPRDYVPDRVAGRQIVITTTNGTAALQACGAAREILVGAIVNRTAVAEAVRRLAATAGDPPVHLVCAGTDGAVGSDDVLAAGAILDAATRAGGPEQVLDDAARRAVEYYRRIAAAPDLHGAIVGEFRRSAGGSNLVALGMEPDLDVAADVDSLAVVPRFDRASASLI